MWTERVGPDTAAAAAALGRPRVSTDGGRPRSSCRRRPWRCSTDRTPGRSQNHQHFLWPLASVLGWGTGANSRGSDMWLKELDYTGAGFTIDSQNLLKAVIWWPLSLFLNLILQWKTRENTFEVWFTCFKWRQLYRLKQKLKLRYDFIV